MGSQENMQNQGSAELNRLKEEIDQLRAWKQRHLVTQKETQAFLAGLLQTARAILEHADFEHTSRAIFDACCGLIGATSGYVALLSDTGEENEVLFLEAGGRPCTVNPELPMPIRGLRAEAYRTGRAVYDNAFSRSKWMAFMPEGHVLLDNVMFAPLNIDGRTVGLMGMANKPGGFTDTDAGKAEAFSDLAAIALDNSHKVDALDRANVAIANSLSAVVSVDLQGRISYANPAAAKMWGFRGPEEMLGADFDGLWTDDGGRRLKSLVKAVLGGTAVWNTETPALRRDGTPFTAEVKATRIVDGSGEPVGHTASFTDITDRKRTQEVLVQTERLRVASQLSEGLCHNLNNILTTVLGPAQMLRRTTRDAGALEDLELIISSTRRATDILRQLQNSVAEQVEASPEAVDLNASAQAVLQMMQPRLDRLKEVGSQVEVDTDLGDVSEVKATVPGLRQMLGALILNALEAMPEGGRLAVHTRQEGEAVVLKISDTGVGMNEETLRKVFEPFFTTKDEVGVGLGLSVLRGTLAQWDGQAEVASSPGEGSTFTLRFSAWSTTWPLPAGNRKAREE
jgi:PAS domain S-box-containing protein